VITSSTSSFVDGEKKAIESTVMSKVIQLTMVGLGNKQEPLAKGKKYAEMTGPWQHGSLLAEESRSHIGMTGQALDTLERLQV
jgi:CobQ-like glutamine amidotransferase family enzyme